MQDLILIKLGGSVITDKDKPFTARYEVIDRLVSEIKEAKKIYKGKLLLGHGGGSFPHVTAAKYKTQLGIINKDSLKGFSLTADAAIKINRIVIESFIKKGLLVASFSPLSFIFTKNTKLKTILTLQLKKALDIGIIPVIYGDLIMDETKGFCIYSGEKTLDLLATSFSKFYKIKKIIMVSDTDGGYDNNKKTIPIINFSNFSKFKSVLLGSKRIDVTGGMIHKVEESLSLAKLTKIPTVIINGNRKNELKKEILGEKTVKTTIKA